MKSLEFIQSIDCIDFLRFINSIDSTQNLFLRKTKGKAKENNEKRRNSGDPVGPTPARVINYLGRGEGGGGQGAGARGQGYMPRVMKGPGGPIYMINIRRVY